MAKPRLLDLFSGAGGSAWGYMLAGFHVTGIDHQPQPRYRGDVFIQSDALAYLEKHGQAYDVIHASPECQGYSVTQGMPWVQARARCIPTVRTALQAVQRPYVIENVPGSTPDLHPTIELCGLSFGLKVLRHRLFEMTWLCLGPQCPGHQSVRIGREGYVCVAGHGDSGHGHIPADHRSAAAWRTAMGIDWMTMRELSQAIPPAYTQWIGTQLMQYLQRSQL